MIHPDLKQQRSAVIFMVYLRLVSDKHLSAVGGAVQGWRTRCQLNATKMPSEVFFSEKKYSPFIWHACLHTLPVLGEKSKEAWHLGVLIYFQQDRGWGFSQAVGDVTKTEQLLSPTTCCDACCPSGCPPCTSAGITRLCQWGRLYVDVCASGSLKYLQAQWLRPSFRKTVLHSDAKICYVFREYKGI